MTKWISLGFWRLCVVSLLLICVLFPVLSQTFVTDAQSNKVTDLQSPVVAQVLRISLMCRDIDVTSKLWAEVLSLPVSEITTTKSGSQSFMDFRSMTPTAEFKRAILQLENTQVEFLQPIGKKASPEAEFVKSHPTGVRRVLFALADSTAPERLNKLGLVKRTQGGRDLYVEAADKFGVVTEWVAVRDQESLDDMTMATESRAQNLPAAPSGGLRSILQVALVAKDMKAMSQRWAEILGVTPPEMPTHESRWIFRGQPTNAQLKAAFVPFGHTEIEIVGLGSGDGSNLFAEFLDKRGVGVQHFAFSVDDMDAAVKHFEELGLGVGMVSASRPDPSRHNNDTHVMDAREKLGVDVELFHRVTCCDRDPVTFNGRIRPLDDTSQR